MSPQEIIEHWRKGAKDALEMAELAYKAEKYDHALFNCQLAIEKGLKTLYMEEQAKDHPRTHDLSLLAHLLDRSFNESEEELFKELTDFAVDARYNDPDWVKEEATRQNTEKWIRRTSDFLSAHLS